MGTFQPSYIPLSRRIPGPEGCSSTRDLARAGEIIVVGIFGVDAALDRVSANRDVVLRKGQFLAGRNADLQMHEIESGN